MSDLSLPFWLLIGSDAEHPPSAFTTTEKLGAFLDSEEPGQWKISLIATPEGLMLGIADVHQTGASVVWLDPTPGAAPQDSIQLVDLMELRARLGAA